MIVLDTTVLVYAVGNDHELREPARRIVEAVERGSVQATTTVEVIQELVHARARRRDPADAAKLGNAFGTLLSPLVALTEESLREGLRLFDREPRLGAFDAVLATTALAAGAEALVSADRAFEAVRRLRWVDLAGDELDELLG